MVPLSQSQDRCQTPPPTSQMMEQVRQQITQWRSLGKQTVTTITTIPVAFHIIRFNDSSANVTNAQIQAQLDTLNVGYGNTNFRFSLHSIRRVNRSDWQYMTYGSQKEIAMKESLAIDPARVLNFYTVDLPGGNLGFARFPSEFPEDSYMHGVVCDFASLPGGSFTNFNQGKTGTHEIGHYLGLWHTFQNGCTSPGDEVEDTPYEASPAYGCPIGRNTCPQPGVDPIHNFMDYSYDPCMYEFTGGQSLRKDSIMAVYRPSIFGIIVTIDQKLADGQTSVDSVGRWEGGPTFSLYPVPRTFSFAEGTQEVLIGSKKIISGQKYHKWNVDDTVVNHRKFTIQSGVTRIQSNFNPTMNGITLRNELIDAPSQNFGSIQFKDPWLVDVTDSRFYESPYGYRNLGMNAPFKQESSPFNPTTASKYKGVFLNQGGTPPYYSVRVPQVQTIGNYTGNFIGWSTTGNTQVINPTNLESPVIFKGANDVVKAQYKGHLLSSKSTATGNNNQRKIVRDASGVYHMVYESGGEIWYTKSTNGGAAWSGEIIISTSREGTLNPKNPSLCSFTSGGTSYLQVVWVEDNLAPSSASIRFRQCINGAWEENIGIISFYRNNYDSKPVVDKGWVAYDLHNNNIGVVKFLSFSSSTPALYLPSVQGKNPAIYSISNTDPICHVVYGDPSNGSIQHRRCEWNSYYNKLSWSGSAINVSQGSNRINNCNPSIASISTHIMYATWQGQNTSNNKTEIIVRRNSYGTWGSFTYFGFSIFPCSDDVNFLVPSISDVGSNDVGIVWQTGGGRLWYAKGGLTDWVTTKLNIEGASYPNISNQTDGSTIRAVCTKNSAAAPYQLLIAAPASPPSQPPAPTLSWTIDGQNPRLNWTSSGDDMLYKLYRYKCPPDEECWPAVIIYEGTATTHKDWQVTVYRKSGGLEPGSQYNYYVTATNYICQASSPSNTVSVLEGLLPAMQKQNLIPEKFSLSDNYPNPFNPQTMIRYQLPEPCYVSLRIYNQLGQSVSQPVNDYQDAGYYERLWDVSTSGGYPTGLYYLQLIVTNQTGKQLYRDTKKLLLVR
ncbi:MAG: M43 family zinc metalloprotease [Bacteroidota bacterium]|nr:M43 family zinc metalloprotease [Bacteroidota bacterium]